MAFLIWSTDVLVALLILLLTFLGYYVCTTFISIWWRSHLIKRVFKSQGFTIIPSDHFFYGNPSAINKDAQCLPMPHITHDIAPRMIPRCYEYPKKYGDRYVFSFGSSMFIDLTSPDEAKEILATKFGHFPKPGIRPGARDLFGKGILILSGEKWAQHRRIMSPAFFVEKLKAMVPEMVTCSLEMIEKWDIAVEQGQEIDVFKEFNDLTADIIAHTAFGSSYVEGKQVFEMQHEQKLITEKLFHSVYIPGTRFLPSAFNRYRWKLDNGIKRVLSQLINKRLESIEAGPEDLYGNDLLGLMMAANKGELQGSQKNLTLGMDEIIDECKTFFFAGHETTSTLLTWTLLLLATSPEWQERTREEVQTVCGMTDTPTADSLNHLKIAGMVLNEALRLYPPVVAMMRQAGSDMQLGKTVIPKGTMLTIPIIAWHHAERYWGADVHEFRPDRFREGIAKASMVPGAFMPFSMGPRVCIGQTFAMLEAKAVLSTILQRYRFCLSPAYRHAPASVITLQPRFGMPMLFTKLNQLFKP